MTEGTVLFYIFIFIMGVILYIPAFLVKNKVYTISFTILSAMTFTFLAFELSTYTILLLVLIGLIIIQFISLGMAYRGKE